MANHLAIGKRLKDALHGPCRYFLMAAGIFTMISAYFTITEPHFESGGFEDRPWWILYDSFIIPIAITKALLACALISYVYKAGLSKNLPAIACVFLLPVSLLWSFVASNHPDDLSLHIYTESYTEFYDLSDSFSWNDFQITGHPVEEFILVDNNAATVKMRCETGFWRFFGNLGYSKQSRLSVIEKQPELINEYCVPVQ